MVNTAERRCKAMSRSGNACRATVVNAAGYCVAHDPEKPMDMRALGRRSGVARRRPNPERVPTSLREELRTLDPAVVKAAIEKALTGNNESARVSAVKLLADVDAFRQDGTVGCPKCRDLEFARGDLQRAMAGFKLATGIVEALTLAEARRRGEKVDEERVREETLQIALAQIDRAPDVIRAAIEKRVAERVAAEGTASVKTVIDELTIWLQTASVEAHPDLIVGDVSAERCQAVLAGLEEVGLLVPRGRVEAMAEEMAAERLLALKQEHAVA